MSEKQKARKMVDTLESKGWKIRVVSPNKPNDPIQWYDATPETINEEKWRIDGQKGLIELTVHPDGQTYLSFYFSLSEQADKQGIELNDEYSIGVSFWAHDDNTAPFPFEKLDEIEPKLSKLWYGKTQKFLKACIKALNESHESTVDEIKRYRSEYAEQGNEEAKP